MNDLHRGGIIIALGFVIVLTYTGVTAATAAAPTATTDTAPDEILIGAMGTGHDGTVTVRHPNGTIDWRYGDALSYNDVSRLPDGRVLAAFQIKSTTCSQYDPPCYKTGARIISPDPNPHVTWEYSFETRTALNSEVHDVEYLPERDALLLVDMDRERLLSVAIDTKEVVWQYNASRRYDAPADPTRVDWLHMNDVDRIAPGEYLVSVRNANQLIVVNRSCQCVTTTINKNHSTQTLFEQHNPQWLGPNAVLVADSENDRVVELHRNPDTDTWTVAWSVYGAGGVPFDWPRDADRLPNGNTLIVDTHNNRVVIIDRQGDLVWSSRTHGQPYDADLDGHEGTGPAYANATGEAHNRHADQPFDSVNLLYAAVQHEYNLPYWVSDWHMFVVLVGLSFVSSGGVFVLQYAWRRRGQSAPHETTTQEG